MTAKNDKIAGSANVGFCSQSNRNRTGFDSDTIFGSPAKKVQQK
jgi:hypothetical protein